jgi:hypothetical protein
VSATEKRKGAPAECRSPKGTRLSGIMLRRLGTARLGGGGSGLRSKRGRCKAGWAGWARLRRDFKWKTDFEIQLNSDFGKTLRNSTRRFRRNLDIRIFFLNSSRLLKDF